MANGYRMQPKPDVWQNVRLAIQAPQRKRRFVLWWWLLPIAFSGGVVAFYALAGRDEEKGQVNANAVVQTTSDNNVDTGKPSNNLQDYSKTKIAASNSSAFLKLQKNKSTGNKHLAAGKTINNAVVDEKTSKAPAAVYVATSPDIKEPLLTGSHRSRNLAALASTSTDKHTSDKMQVVQDPVIVQRQDSTVLALPPIDAPIPVAAAMQADTGKAAIGAADNIKPVLSRTKQSKVHWGILAEGGIAARKSSVWSFAGVGGEKSTTATNFPNNNDFSTGIGMPGTGSFYYTTNIQHGTALAMGVALQKRVGKNIDFIADVAYHYQSFSIATAVYKDSLVLNSAFSAFTGSYEAAQSFHFTSVFAGINWYTVHTKPLQLGVSAGIDNLFLLKAQQEVSSITSPANFTLERAASSSDSAFATNSFTRYQPSLFAGVLVNIKTGKTQLQLVPFVRSSFRQFDNSQVSNNNHLFSAGMRAVYYFK